MRRGTCGGGGGGGGAGRKDLDLEGGGGKMVSLASSCTDVILSIPNLSIALPSKPPPAPPKNPKMVRP